MKNVLLCALNSGPFFMGKTKVKNAKIVNKCLPRGQESGPVMNALVLNTKKDEQFTLTDTVSGIVTKIKIFYRRNNSLAVRFEAEPQIKISREQIRK